MNERLKQLFCRHEWEFNFRNDEPAYVCIKCLKKEYDLNKIDKKHK